MGGPRLTDEQKLRIYELKREGHSNRRVAEILGEESPNRVVPDQSTIYRLAKRLRFVQADDRWEWDKMEEAGMPWEAGQKILEAWHEYELADAQLRIYFPRRSLPFTNRLARWYWRVTEAAPTLSARDTLWVAAEYAVRDQAYELLGTPVEMGSWNVWLAYRPWESLGHWRAYTSAVGRELISPRPVSDALDFFRRPQGHLPEDPKRSDHVEIAAVRVMGTKPEGALLSEPHWYLGDGREVYALPLSLGHALVDWLLYNRPLLKEEVPYATFVDELEKDVERRRQG